MNFMGGTLGEWKETGCSWPDYIKDWNQTELDELERRIKAVPFPKSGYWDTILTYPLDLVLWVVEDKDAEEMQDSVMRCVLEYRKEIGK